MGILSPICLGRTSSTQILCHLDEHCSGQVTTVRMNKFELEPAEGHTNDMFY